MAIYVVVLKFPETALGGVRLVRIREVDPPIFHALHAAKEHAKTLVDNREVVRATVYEIVTHKGRRFKLRYEKGKGDATVLISGV